MNNEMLNGEIHELTIGELDAVTGGAGVVDTIVQVVKKVAPGHHRHHRRMHGPLVFGLNQDPPHARSTNLTVSEIARARSKLK